MIASMTAYQRIVAALGALAALTLVLGWILPEPGRTSMDAAVDPPAGLACTEIGCDSGISLNLATVRKAVPKARSVRLCVDAKCQTVKLKARGYQGFVMRVNGLGVTASLRMVLKDGKGRTIRRQILEAPVSRLQPNGENCPPVCFQVRVRVSKADGRLVALPPATPQA